MHRTRRTLATAVFLSLVGVARGDETLRVSNAPSGAAGNRESMGALLSGDGRLVAFASSASDLVPGDTNNRRDLFLLDRASGALELVTSAFDGTPSNGDASLSALSEDGRYVVFASNATNLLAAPLTQRFHVYRRDRQLGLTELVSVDDAGTPGDSDSGGGSISADGSLVVFQSAARNLVASDTNNATDVFLRDLVAGTTRRLSVTAADAQGNKASYLPILCGDGSVAFFTSEATNFPGWCDDPKFTRGEAGVYSVELATGALERVDVADDESIPYCMGGQIACSATRDGTLLLLATIGALEPGDDNGDLDAYLRDRVQGTTTRITRGPYGLFPDHFGDPASMSADGSLIAFDSQFETVDPPDDDQKRADVFLLDRRSGVLKRLSISTDDASANGSSGIAASGGGRVISDDGRTIAFGSYASSLVADDLNLAGDVFLRARLGIAADSAHYGTGFPGRDGVLPTLDALEPPRHATTLELALGNSARFYAVGFVLAGVAPADFETRHGATFLVEPQVVLAVPLTPTGATLAAYIPDEHDLYGVTLYAQLVVLDPWAVGGLSFSDGLELVLGD